MLLNHNDLVLLMKEFAKRLVMISNDLMSVLFNLFLAAKTTEFSLSWIPQSCIVLTNHHQSSIRVITIIIIIILSLPSAPICSHLISMTWLILRIPQSPENIDMIRFSFLSWLSLSSLSIHKSKLTHDDDTIAVCLILPAFNY